MRQRQRAGILAAEPWRHGEPQPSMQPHPMEMEGHSQRWCRRDYLMGAAADAIHLEYGRVRLLQLADAVVLGVVERVAAGQLENSQATDCLWRRECEGALRHRSHPTLTD